MYAIYGLMDNGYTTEACALAESSVRDVVRAQFIAEAYTSDDKPAVSGVRPSICGAIQLIDSVWILNGFRYDSGAPRTHTLFGGGYIENLHVNGKIFNAESVSNQLKRDYANIEIRYILSQTMIKEAKNE